MSRLEAEIERRAEVFIEKHGGLWPSGEPTTFELFDETSQLLGVVSESGGLFVATIHEKSAAPQWRLPVWRELRPSALFGLQTEAIQHIRSTLYSYASR